MDQVVTKYQTPVRLDKPMKPISAVPNNQAAAGTGTAETEENFSLPPLA